MPDALGGSGPSLNIVDLIFALVIALAMARGYVRGLLATVAAYVAPILAFMIAADWSDPVRDKLAASTELPDIALDLLAPVLLFLAVLAIVRLIAAVLARFLGVGRSMPGRVLGAAASGAIVAILLGAGVLMTHEVSPLGGRAAREGGAQAPEPRSDPLADFVIDVDRRFQESLLAPAFAALATTVVHKATGRDGDIMLLPEELHRSKEKAAQAAIDAAMKSSMKVPAPKAPASPPPAAPASPPPPAAAPADQRNPDPAR